jgi:hypothetical protein
MYDTWKLQPAEIPIMWDVFAGVINTEAQDGNAQAMGVTKDELLAQYASLHAVRRVGEPQEIASSPASTCLWMAAPLWGESAIASLWLKSCEVCQIHLGRTHKVC